MTTPHRDFTVEPIRHFTLDLDEAGTTRATISLSRDVTFTTRIRFPENMRPVLLCGCSLSDRRFRALNARTS
jgi:hypothetical protein